MTDTLKRRAIEAACQVYTRGSVDGARLTALDHAIAAFERVMAEDAEAIPTYADLHSYGYAPGDYYCHCYICKKQHISDKRAQSCRECAVERWQKDAAAPGGDK